MSSTLPPTSTTLLIVTDSNAWPQTSTALNCHRVSTHMRSFLLTGYTICYLQLHIWGCHVLHIHI
jgi:hypothetical protein